MNKEVDLRVEPHELDALELHRERLAIALEVSVSRIRSIRLLKRGVDARRKHPLFVLRYQVFVDEVAPSQASFEPAYSSVQGKEAVIVVGAGPAGLFAALRLLESGFRPIVVERGKEIKARRRDVAKVSKLGLVDADSNYCFGEGGAGTFSDGKLYTRSTKRGDVHKILQTLVYHGASPEILIEAHPHIGTNKLPKVISAVSESIRSCGGSLLFGERVTGVIRDASGVSGVMTASGLRVEARAVVLATGHSARDVFYFLNDQGISIEAKPFALGVRVEHPQSHIDLLQYGTAKRHVNLPSASYSFRTQSEGRAVFSFCMCPGGVICPAATGPDEVVVNGWSPSKRNTRFANSGIVVEVAGEDFRESAGQPALAALEFQHSIEQKAFTLGGGALVAPAQRLSDLLSNRVSSSLPECSYNPGLRSVSLEEVFPSSIFSRLCQAFKEFDRQRPGFLSNDAVVVATESRTSSPVRIPRVRETLMHPQLAGLFPCGEGAGYAGGIMSAALDGERVADAVVQYLARS